MLLRLPCSEQPEAAATTFHKRYSVGSAHYVGLLPRFSYLFPCIPFFPPFPERPEQPCKLSPSCNATGRYPRPADGHPERRRTELSVYFAAVPLRSQFVFFRPQEHQDADRRDKLHAVKLLSLSGGVAQNF